MHSFFILDQWIYHNLHQWKMMMIKLYGNSEWKFLLFWLFQWCQWKKTKKKENCIHNEIEKKCIREWWIDFFFCFPIYPHLFTCVCVCVWAPVFPNILDKNHFDFVLFFVVWIKIWAGKKNIWKQTITTTTTRKHTHIIWINKIKNRYKPFHYYSVIYECCRKLVVFFFFVIFFFLLFTTLTFNDGPCLYIFVYSFNPNQTIEA